MQSTIREGLAHGVMFDSLRGEPGVPSAPMIV
jgi:hypothetical protein